MVVEDVVVVVVVDGAVVVAAVVSVGKAVDVEVVVSSPPDEHAASASASTAVNARPRRYLIGTPLSPMPPRVTIEGTRHTTGHAHPNRVPRVAVPASGAPSPQNRGGRDRLSFCGLTAAYTGTATLGCSPRGRRSEPTEWDRRDVRFYSLDSTDEIS